MAQPQNQSVLGAVDIGSSKVSAIICTTGEDGRLRVLGTGQRESRGVKRGYVTDMSASEHAVREAVELAERMSGLPAASFRTLPRRTGGRPSLPGLPTRCPPEPPWPDSGSVCDAC